MGLAFWFGISLKELKHNINISLWHCLLGIIYIYIESTTSLFFTETYSSTNYLDKELIS